MIPVIDNINNRLADDRREIIIPLKYNSFFNQISEIETN